MTNEGNNTMTKQAWVILALILTAVIIAAIWVTVAVTSTMRDIDAGNDRTAEYDRCIQWMTDDMAAKGQTGDQVDDLIIDFCLDQATE